MLRKIELDENGKHIGWMNEDKKIVGSAFTTKEGTIGLIRCPKCGEENYAPSVLSGYCAWCEFSAHRTTEKK